MTMIRERWLLLKCCLCLSGLSCCLLRSKASACLLHTDPRSRYLVRLPAKLPGMHYSADEQCQILFGTNATFCTDMEVGGKRKGVYYPAIELSCCCLRA